MTPLSDHPPANGFNNSEVPREAARLLLAMVNTEHPIASTVDAVSAGISVGMSYRDMAHLVGVTENTLRKRMAKAQSDRIHDPAQVELAVRIASAHAARSLELDELAQLIGLHSQTTLEGARANQAAELCAISEDEGGVVYVTALPAAIAELRAFINRYFMSQPDRFTVVLGLGQLSSDAVRDALDEIDPTGDLGVIYPSDTLATPEEGNGELLLRIAAASPAAAISIAEGPWHSILEKMGEPRSVPPVVDCVPPGNHRYVGSPVLTAFFDKIRPTETLPASTIEAYRASYLGDSDEVELTARCLQAAARAIRRAAGNQREPQLVNSGGTAFMEGSIAHQLILNSELDRIKTPAVKSLMIGADRLGPIPAGRLGHFKTPDGQPHIVESVSPTPEDRIEMAALAGKAVGEAVAQEVLSIEDALGPVVRGS